MTKFLSGIIAILLIALSTQAQQPQRRSNMAQPNEQFALVASDIIVQDGNRSIERIAGNLYRFQNASHVAVFYIWDEGVVVTDPINTEAATWLRARIAELTDLPVTHLIYSHSHLDHASGGQVFSEAREVIAHANAPQSIDGMAINRRFSDEMSLRLGDAQIELSYLGPGHGEDLVAMVFRPEDVLFVVDAVSVQRLPYSTLAEDVDAAIAQIENAEALDFDIVVSGHGTVGDRQDVVDHRHYFQALRAGVLRGLQQGRTVEELQNQLMLEQYSDWQSYDEWRELNIEGMARFLRDSGALN